MNRSDYLIDSNGRRWWLVENDEGGVDVRCNSFYVLGFLERQGIVRYGSLDPIEFQGFPLNVRGEMNIHGV